MFVCVARLKLLKIMCHKFLSRHNSGGLCLRVQMDTDKTEIAIEKSSPNFTISCETLGKFLYLYSKGNELGLQNSIVGSRRELSGPQSFL